MVAGACAVPVQPIKPGGNRDEDIRRTKALLSNGTTFVMDDSCLDPRLYDIEGKGFKLKRFTGSSNLNDIVPAMVKQESDMTLLDVPDVLIAMEKWSGSIKVLGPISEEQRMAAGFRRPRPSFGRHSMNFSRASSTGRHLHAPGKKYFRAAPRYLPEFFHEIPRQAGACGAVG